MATFTLGDKSALARLPWTVLQVSGEESLSSLFEFTVTAAVEASEAIDALDPGQSLESAALLQPTALTLSDEPGALVRRGLAVGVSVLGVVPATVERAEAFVVRFEVRPTAWRSRQRKRSRVFHEKYLHVIVSTVLAELGVRHRWALANVYPRRVYAVQYDETDWEFVTRLLAEEGIFFFFEHGSFAGGSTPGDEAPSGWDKARGDLATAGKVAGVGLGLANDVSGTGGAAGRYAAGGAVVLGAAGDVLPDGGDEDEEADRPTHVPLTGQAGPPGDGDVLVFADRTSAYTDSLRTGRRIGPFGSAPAGLIALAGRLSFVLEGAAGMVTDATALSTFIPRGAVRPTQAHLRDYWFVQPLLEVSALYPPGAAQDFQIYHHHGEYERPDVNAENAQVHLEQHRAEAATYLGEGAQPELGPGVLFDFRPAPGATPTAREDTYVAVRVWHEWRLPDDAMGVGDLLRLVEALRPRTRRAPLPSHALQSTRFEAVAKSVAFRPPRPVRAPRTGVELATVVGPVGEDVYTDAHGRIKVQFHWDREGRWSPSSSCWVRVAQAWAGAGFGAMFLPRVGMEVVVAFVGGDPDRPVVVGTLYNGIHPTIEALPDKKTRSGFRTQLSPDGGDGNELIFEDDKDNAFLRLAAQKDLEVQVGDNRTASVKADDTVSVGGDRRVGVAGDHVLGVGGARVALVSEGDSLQVGGDRATRVSRNASAFVEGDALTAVSGVGVERFEDDALRSVGGDHTLRVDGDAVTHVGGKARDGDAHAVTFVEGSWRLGATRTVSLAADADGSHDDARLTLRCGNSSITLSPEEIVIQSTVVKVVGQDTLELHGDHASLMLDSHGHAGRGDEIRLETSGGDGYLHLLGSRAVLAHNSCARVQGSHVHLVTSSGSSNSNHTNDNATPPEANLYLRLTDEERRGEASDLPEGTRWRVIGAGHEDFAAQGALAAGGQLQVYVPDGVEVIDVFAWPGEQLPHAYPEKGPLHWKVHLVESLGSVGDRASADTFQAVRRRLRNLGYLPAADITGGEMDDATATAIRRFQRDQRLKVADEEEDNPLDPATLDKLRTVYGA